MSPDVQQQLSAIKRDLHAAMNGPVSASLRDKGLRYRVIYGVEWPRLVALSQQIGKSHALAQALWKEDIRECRLLAGLVQPSDTFDGDLAEVWIETMHYPEEAQYTVMSLFQHIDDASTWAFRWIADSRPMHQLCGWLLLSRLFMRGAPLNARSEDEFVDQAEAALDDTDRHVAAAAKNAVTKYAMIGEREALRVAKIMRKHDF